MNRANNATLIKLEDVTKVFLTDEIETHALSGIQLEIKAGEYVCIAGPSAALHHRFTGHAK
jgi:putative ABC transport system ATP-binding protein